MIDFFCMEEKRKDETNSEVLARVEECVKNMKWMGGSGPPGVG